MADDYFDLMLPWSGPVRIAQAWANIFKPQSQVGLFNVIEQMEAKDSELEQRVVSEGFSYGSQLGRIIDVLKEVIPEPKVTKLQDPAHCKNSAVEQFWEMARKIDEIKIGRIPLSEDDDPDFIRRMKILKEKDPELYREVLLRMAKLMSSILQ